MALVDVIKYEGDNGAFVQKFPGEDFNTSSQLIVHESQEAVFFSDGRRLDVFGPGRYTLETRNIPLLRRVANIPTGGQSPFHCEVYFVNKAEIMSVRWGTDSRIQYMEPSYGFPLSVGASGEMSLRAADSKKLLVKLVGTEKDLSRERLALYFRGFLMSKVKAYIARILKSEKINIFEIDSKLLDFSRLLKEKLTPDFADYGVSLERFFVTTVSKPDGDPRYEKFKELHFRRYADVAEARLRRQVGVIDKQTEAQKIIIESEALAAKRRREGYTYRQERGFDVAEKVASNEAVGRFTNMGVGLGTMAGVGGVVGGLVGNAVSGAVRNPGPEPGNVAFCDNCGARLRPDAAFCDNCGAPVSSPDRCPHCGYVFKRPGKFCPGCGRRRQ